MLPHPQRLNLKKDFKWVVSGKFLDFKFAKIYIKLGDNKDPKFGIAISSKNFKQATDRNRARRIMSSAIQPLYSRFPQSLNMILLPKTAILSVKSGDVLLELEQKLEEAKLINEKSNN